MYVCICKAVSEKDLMETMKTCGRNLREVQKSCGAATNCGACLEKVEKYLCDVNLPPNTPSESAKKT